MVQGMNRFVIPLAAALAGSLTTWALLTRNSGPSAAAAPGLTGSNAKVQTLEKEVAQLREQLAKQKTETAVKSAAAKEVAAAAQNPEAEAEARREILKRRRADMEKRLEEKVARLTKSLNLTPEQAQAAKDWHRSWLEAQLAASEKVSPGSPGLSPWDCLPAGPASGGTVHPFT